MQWRDGTLIKMMVRKERRVKRERRVKKVMVKVVIKIIRQIKRPELMLVEMIE